MKALIISVLIAAIAVFAWSLLPPPQLAQTGGTGQTTASGTGVVQRVDKEAGVVTIAHGPLPALNMRPMTMSYPIRDKAQLANLQPMQKVEFQLSYDGKEYSITGIR